MIAVEYAKAFINKVEIPLSVPETKIMQYMMINRGKYYRTS